MYKLLPPDSKATNRQRHLQIKKGSNAHHALADLRTLLKLVANRPTRCTQLIPGWPHFVGFCDACKHGAGGVWLSGQIDIHPVVWRIPWPSDITSRYDDGRLSINDLEMAGLLLHYLTLEQLGHALDNTHAATWCDNTSAVSWVSHHMANSSLVAQQLLRALYLQHAANQSSPLAPLTIAGANNKMADLAS